MSEIEIGNMNETAESYALGFDILSFLSANACIPNAHAVRMR